MVVAGRVIASARLIALLTICSRLLGLVREILFSRFFGAGGLLSAFRIAFMVPNLARRLFGEGALSAAMIPVLTESIQTEGEEPSRRFVGALLLRLGAVLVGLVVVAEIVVGLWRHIADDLALELTAILLPYAALICTVAVAGGVLHVRNHFAIPAASPVILNLCIIAAIAGGALWLGMEGIDLIYLVCGAVLVAGVLQLAAVFIALKAKSFLPKLAGSRRDPRVRQVAMLMLPMILGLSAVQINSLADYVIAYLFISVDGERVGPAVLGFAQYLYQLPLGVFGIALATAIFPVLSRKAAEGNLAAVGHVFSQGMRLAIFVALPATVGLIVVARLLVAALYQHKAFDADDTARVAGVLVFYSLGLAAYFTQHVVVRTYYALQDSRTPAKVAMRMVLLNLAMNLALVFPLQERGLALATAVCAVIQVCWLLVKLPGLTPTIAWASIATCAGKTLAATAVMACVLGLLLTPGVTGRLLAGHDLARLITLVIAGVISFTLAARVMRIDELNLIMRTGRASSENAE